jgi:flagellin
MIISHNISSLFASRQEGINTQALQKSMEKLASGEKINRAGDDASGLAVSEKMRSQIRGLNQASRNIGDAISFTNVAEGYLQETTDVLQRIRELAVQASNGVYSDEDRMQIQVEVSQLVAEVDRIASSAQFNGMSLLTGRFAKESDTVMQLQIGANADQNVRVYIGTMTSQALGLTGIQGTDEKISINSPDEANLTITVLDNALKNVNKQRADLGAYGSRMEMAQKGINISAENLTSANSRIRDTDMAVEMTEYTKNQVLQQASSALLAQSLDINRSAVSYLLR